MQSFLMFSETTQGPVIIGSLYWFFSLFSQAVDKRVAYVVELVNSIPDMIVYTN